MWGPRVPAYGQTSAYGYGYRPPVEVNSHLVMAIFAMLVCWMVGIPALVYAIHSMNSANRGDAGSAQWQAAKARKWSIASFCVGGGLLLIYLVIVIAVVATGGASTGGGYAALGR